MDVLNPICTNCGGTGNDGAGRDPLCKGAGRMALDEHSPVGEWVRWIREQPDVLHGVEVLARLIALPAPPAGLRELVESKKDDE